MAPLWPEKQNLQNSWLTSFTNTSTALHLDFVLDTEA
jgi:hypothetical protein